MTGVLGALAAAPVSLAEAGPAQANHLRESSCRDVVAGAARYDRDRHVDVPVFSDAGYPQELKKDGGRVVGAIRLAEPSCPTVDYLMYVFRTDGSVLLSRVVSGVTGLEQVDFTATVTGYAHNCLAVQFVTRVGDVVVDLAPDSLGSYETVCDGYSSGLAYR